MFKVKTRNIFGAKNETFYHVVRHDTFSSAYFGSLRRNSLRRNASAGTPPPERRDFCTASAGTLKFTIFKHAHGALSYL